MRYVRRVSPTFGIKVRYISSLSCSTLCAMTSRLLSNNVFKQVVGTPLLYYDAVILLNRGRYVPVEEAMMVRPISIAPQMRTFDPACAESTFSEGAGRYLDLMIPVVPANTPRLIANPPAAFSRNLISRRRTTTQAVWMNRLSGTQPRRPL